jgi:hypothetical protein
MDGEGDAIGKHGNFVLKRSDGRVETYSGELIGVSATHFTIRMRDGRECSLLRGDIQKVEWVRA